MKRNFGLDPGLAILIEKAPQQELDYGFVMDCLKTYANPRVKLSHLLKIGGLIRVKKGIYVFGEHFAKEPYSKEILANMIYGPSYISLEWACQHYRLIPERVVTVTSITTQRTRSFKTPLGPFTYDHLPLSAYPVGIRTLSLSNGREALFATREKALTDLLVLRRGRMTSKKQVETTLFDDLRIDEEDLQNFDLALLQEIYQAQPHSAIHYLIKMRNT